jgi:hypothetical protein
VKAAVLWGALMLAGCGATGYHPNNLECELFLSQFRDE